MTKTLNFYADPGHGWLKVPISDLHELNIADQISKFSYVRGTMAYLEEDCDAPRYLKAAEAKGWTIKVRHFHSNRDSRIRSYNRYNRT